MVIRAETEEVVGAGTGVVDRAGTGAVDRAGTGVAVGAVVRGGTGAVVGDLIDGMGIDTEVRTGEGVKGKEKEAKRKGLSVKTICLFCWLRSLLFYCP